MRRAALPAEPVPPMIVLSVRITDGSFESNVNIALDASPAEKNAATLRWLEIMQFGLKQHGSDIEIRTATPRKENPHAE
jgi:hypothetical protein